MWSSWLLFVTDSILGLVDSCASAIQLNLGLCHTYCGFSPLTCNGFPIAGLGNRLFTGHCRSHRCSNFRLAFLMMSSYSSSVGWIQWIPLKLLAFSSFGFSSAHSCFSFLWTAFPILAQASGHIWSGRDVVWFFVSLHPGPHVSFWRCFFQ